MNWKTILLTIILADFSVVTALALAETGYLGLLEAAMANWATIQIFTDLVIICALAIVWMHEDARARGTNAWPFIVITLFAGSFGPLLYLLRREWRGRRRLRAGHAPA